MTSTWHDVSTLDLVHLQGARSLFRKWIFSSGTGLVRPALGHAQTMFLVGVMAFWESLASFHVNQNLATVDYLWDVWDSQSCAEIEGCRSHPLTGISTPLFIHLAQVGTLSRQMHLLDKLGHLSGTPIHEGEMYHSLLGQARNIEFSVRSFVVSSADQIQDTGDAFTPPTHLETIGKVYQLSILLEVYRLFPDLLCLDGSRPQGYFRHILVTLAINILTLLATIAHTSRTKAIQVLPLTLAGSALQADPERLVDVPLLPLTCQDPSQGIMSLSSQDTNSVGHAKQIVEGVWMRADINPQQTFVSWMDVMMEENLSTFFG
ncbi:hypothetical protein N7541_000063 [Penicillium brevicompactum]|uniref:Transcription factor domain-containing protein n=1 Tax=Penicillium brevicompactum TaxID=5074 RepID=A0A9W9RTT6_PENBR|nr:hypothetical protein N7541_000063 [Penicillium brevicompactum]